MFQELQQLFTLGNDENQRKNLFRSLSFGVIGSLGPVGCVPPAFLVPVGGGVTGG